MHCAWGETAVFPLPVKKSDVTIVFLDPDFQKDAENLGNSAINKVYIAYFSLRMRETTVFPLLV